MLILEYFYKSILFYGLLEFFDQKPRINRIEKIMIKSIKKLLKKFA